MIYVASSCRYGYRLSEVMEYAQRLGVGVQLCAGNFIDCDPQTYGVPLRTHHGWHPQKRVSKVWDLGTITGYWDSVHSAPYGSHLRQLAAKNIAVEFSSHGSTLDAISAARHCGVSLAVDVAHLSLSGTRTEYLNHFDIAEIHVARPGQTGDAHLPFGENDYGVQWARSHPAPKVIESYVQDYDTLARLVDILR